MKLGDKVNYRDNYFWIMLLIAVTFISLTYGLYNMQKRIDILSEKVRVLEYQMKDNSGEHVYTSSIKETI